MGVPKERTGGGIVRQKMQFQPEKAPSAGKIGQPLKCEPNPYRSANSLRAREEHHSPEQAMTYSAQDIANALLRIKEDGFVLDNDAFGYAAIRWDARKVRQDLREAGYAGAELVQGRMMNEGEEICWLYNPEQVGKGKVDRLAAARHSALYGEYSCGECLDPV
jgi:hypothetical protein